MTGQGRTRGGFTLLELLVVVVVIGILASLALPKFVKTIEKARIAEAKTWLGTVRSAMTRYRADHDNHTTVLAQLDVDNPNNQNPRYYNYVVVVGGDPGICVAPGSPPAEEPFWIVATRVSTQGRPSPPPGVTPVNYVVKISDIGHTCDNLD